MAEAFRLYADDLVDNPRRYGEESSDTVAALWTRKQDAYVREDLPPDAPADIRDVYWRLTAERILFRRKVLGLPVAEDVLRQAQGASARPFLGCDHALSEFLRGGVKVAMAFVPLTPLAGDDVNKPELARLYCASWPGLGNLNGRIPFDRCGNPPGAENYSWFLCGCERNPPPRGESWHLAAELLMWTLRQGDAEARRHLASRFVVTGRVDFASKKILRVDIGRKQEIVETAGVPELKKLTWIVPFENKEEMSENMKVVCPKTLDEAYELIKTMQNGMTEALGALVRGDAVDSRPLLSHVKHGADASAVDPKSGMNARQAYKMSSLRRQFKLSGALADYSGEAPEEKAEAKREAAVKLFFENDSNTSLMNYYAGIPQMFFLLAKCGCEEALAALAERFDIDALDERGMTALDFAIEHEETAVADVLRHHGATLRGVYRATSWDVFWNVFMLSRGAKKETVPFLLEALEKGCDPNAVIEFGVGLYATSTCTRRVDVGDPVTDVDAYGELYGELNEDYDYRLYVSKRRRSKTTVFLEALYSGNEALMDACAAHGGSMDALVLTSGSAEKLDKEFFPVSAKETIAHNPVFADADFGYWGECSIRELVDEDGYLHQQCCVWMLKQAKKDKAG